MGRGRSGTNLGVVLRHSGEILHGTLAASWPKARIAAIESRLQAYPVIPGTIGVSRKFAELQRWFYLQIGDNDLWIAACVLAHPEPVSLATSDADFDNDQAIETAAVECVVELERLAGRERIGRPSRRPPSHPHDVGARTDVGKRRIR